MGTIKIILAVIAIVIVVGIVYGALDPNTEGPSIVIGDVETEMMKPSGLFGEVTIGSIYPLTGDLERLGIEESEASKFGVIEFNKYLQENGEPWQLKMVLEDSATSPDIALEKLTALNAKGIEIIVGPETSSNINNVKDYANSNNMVLVSCCSSASALSIPNDGVFRLVPDDSNQGPAIAKLMQHEGIEVMVPVWRGDTWADGLADSTTESFMERGGMVSDNIRYNPESPEFSASASLLAEYVQEYVDEYGADKVGVLVLGFGEVLEFTHAASEHEILDDVRWFGSGVNKEHNLTNDPIGLEFLTNAKFTTVQVAPPENPTYEKVQKHMIETLGADPSTFVYSAYDAVWLIGLTMLETQSSDAGMIKAAIPSVAENYNGAIGPVKLNEAGDLEQSNYKIWGIIDGTWIELGTYIMMDDSIFLD